VPQHIRSDNGPEFIAQAIKTWLTNSNVETLYIPPGAPWENGSAESFHSRLRDEFLNAEEFDNLTHARVLSMTWRLNYNHRRPHSALDYQTPAEFAATCAGRDRSSGLVWIWPRIHARRILFSSFRNSTHFASSLLLADAINASRGWKILAAMLLSQLVIKVESDTFVEQRYVLGREHRSRRILRPLHDRR
jgi:hypothetical protein